MNENLADSWYAVRTQPRAELRAFQHLKFQGYEVYLPRYLKRRRHARKFDIIAAPLFPRYLFVAVNAAMQRWRSIHSTVGVSQLVCIGDQPATVSQDVVENLRQREDKDGYIQLPKQSSFVRGEKIRIVHGVFLNTLGLFENMTDGERVSVLLDLLGRKVRVVIDVEAVTAA